MRILLALLAITLVSGCHLLKAKPLPEETAFEQTLGIEKISEKLKTSAGQYELGELYLQRQQPGDMENALTLLEKSANAGYAPAQFRYGQLLVQGYGIEKDLKTGAAWLRMAAASGVDEAQVALADLYAQGNGVEQNWFKAKRWYDLAAKQENPQAMLKLGKAYIASARNEEDYQSALHWFELAGNLGLAEGKYFAAKLYASGVGGGKDLNKALTLFQQAAKAGYVDAIAEVGQLLRYGTSNASSDPLLAEELLQEAISKGSGQAAFEMGSQYEFGEENKPQDFAKAAEWYQKAVDAGYPYAAYRLGELYRLGFGVDKNTAKANVLYETAAANNILPAIIGLADGIFQDPTLTKESLTRAIQFYQRAADLGDPYSQYMLSEFYRLGLGVEQNLQTSVDWFYRADNLSDNARAKYQVAMHLAKGVGFASDEPRAFEWLMAAANQKYPKALVTLGDWYSLGLYVPRDYRQAHDWYQKAAAQGSPEAEYNLGLLYYNGQGVVQDMQTAFTWFEKAAKSGVTPAQYQIAEMYYQGVGVSQNDVNAYAWWSLSTSQQSNSTGHPLQKIIARMPAYEQEKALVLAQNYQEKYGKKLLVE